VGAALTYALRLSPNVSGSLTVDYSRIDAVAPSTITGQSKQGSMRGEIGVRLAPKSSLRFGAEYRKLASTLVPPGSEALVSVELDHTF
jgi:hypothetical protein